MQIEIDEEPIRVTRRRSSRACAVESGGGSVLLASASTDCMLMRNLRVRLRCMYTDVLVSVAKSSFTGVIAYKTNTAIRCARLLY